MTEDTDFDFDAEQTENNENDAIEQSEQEPMTLDEYQERIMQLHNSLDQIKETSQAMGADLEARLPEAETDAEKERLQRLVHQSVTLFQRIERGDRNVLRGM